MAVKASHRSQRRAVRSHATGFPFSLSPLTWTSGGVFLVSAISEYGFDIDFPLTPTLWLAIAVCAVLITCATRTTTGASAICAVAMTAVVALLATRHGGACDSRQHKRHHCPPIPQTRVFLQSRAKPTRPKNETGPRPSIECGIVACACLLFRLCTFHGAIHAESHTMQAMILLNPARPRGPPSHGERQSTAPVRPLRASPLPSLSLPHPQRITTEPGITLRSFPWRTSL